MTKKRFKLALDDSGSPGFGGVVAPSACARRRSGTRPSEISFYFSLSIEIRTICEFFFPTINVFDIFIDGTSDLILRSYTTNSNRFVLIFVVNSSKVSTPVCPLAFSEDYQGRR